MSADSTILAGRQFNEALMESTCVITRTSAVAQPSDGSNPTTTTTVYSGICRLKSPSPKPANKLVQGQSVADGDAVLCLPMVGSNGVRAEDVAVVTVGALDPGTTTTVRVNAPYTQTHATERRFPVTVLN